MHVRHVPLSSVSTPFEESLAPFFSGQSRWWNLSWKIRANSSALLVSLPTHVPSCSLHKLSTLHNPSTLVRRSRLAPSSGASPKQFPRFTVHPRPSVASVSLPPAELPPSYFHASQSITPVRRFRLAPSSGAPPSYFHASQSITPVRRFRLAPSSGAPPKLFPRFTLSPSRSITLVRRSRLAPSSGDPPKLFPSYFHAFHSVRARAFLPSSLPRFLPSFIPFLPSLLPSFITPFLPAFLPARAFLPSLLVRLFWKLPSRQSKLNENPSIGDAFGKNIWALVCRCLQSQSSGLFPKAHRLEAAQATTLGPKIKSIQIPCYSAHGLPSASSTGHMWKINKCIECKCAPGFR